MTMYDEKLIEAIRNCLPGSSSEELTELAQTILAVIEAYLAERRGEGVRGYDPKLVEAQLAVTEANLQQQRRSEEDAEAIKDLLALCDAKDARIAELEAKIEKLERLLYD